LQDREHDHTAIAATTSALNTACSQKGDRSMRYDY
jgi:hypothetical protein